MKIYFSHRKIPELSGLQKKKQDLAWKKYHRMSFKNWKAWLAFVFLILFQIGIEEFKYYLKVSFPDIHWGYIYHPITILSWSISLLIVFQVTVAVARSYMAKDVQKFGANWIDQ